MKTIADLKHDDFSVLIGETFDIGPHQAKLAKVELGPETPDEFRQQFSLTFDCPEGFAGDHNTYALSHEKIGTHAVFMSKVMGSGNKPSLQIIFG
ncbi:DUF6916 family protein [Pseudovibrio exalbescens]|nr:hypothetical protein [Pseudovibrio exalbescens]